MQIRLRLGICTVVSLICLAGLAGHANPLHDPKRIVAGRQVDLTPLFRWWTNRSGARPLTAWTHVIGSVIGTNAWGWTLQAQVENSPDQTRVSSAQKPLPGGETKVVLRNPPLWEMVQFDILTAQLQELSEQRQFLLSQSSEAAALVREINSTPHRSRAASAQVRQLNLTQTQAKTLIKTIDLQIQDCRAKLAAFPVATRFTVDCLALNTGQEFHGIPVFDCGLPLPDSPANQPPAKTPKAP